MNGVFNSLLDVLKHTSIWTGKGTKENVRLVEFEKNVVGY